MPKTLNGQNQFTSNITLFPISGNNEGIEIEPLEAAIQKLLNNTLYLKQTQDTIEQNYVRRAGDTITGQLKVQNLDILGIDFAMGAGDQTQGNTGPSRVFSKRNSVLGLNLFEDFAEIHIGSRLTMRNGRDIFFAHAIDPGDLIWARGDTQVARIWTDAAGLHLGAELGTNGTELLLRPDKYLEASTLTFNSPHAWTAHGWRKALELPRGHVLKWWKGDLVNALGFGVDDGGVFRFITNTTENGTVVPNYPLWYTFQEAGHEAFRLNASGPALQLGAGPEADNIYMAFYGNPNDSGARSGWIGYNYEPHMHIANDKPNGNVHVHTNGGKFLVNNKELGIAPIEGRFSTPATQITSGSTTTLTEVVISSWNPGAAATNGIFSVQNNYYPGIVCTKRGVYAISGYVELSPIGNGAGGRRKVSLEIQTGLVPFLGLHLYTPYSQSEMLASEGETTTHPVSAVAIIETGYTIKLNLVLLDANTQPDLLNYTAFLTIVRLAEL